MTVSPDFGDSEIVGEYGVRPLYRMLGYFSIIGLLRVHTLLGDFTLALKVMDNVELAQKVVLDLQFIDAALNVESSNRHPSLA